MDPVSASILIEAPREEVFDYLADIANHSEFTGHYLVDWHLTRENSVGRGAGARFRVKAPGNRFGWGDVTLAELERPYRIVEVGRSGKGNRVRTVGVYEMVPGSAHSTRVTFTLRTEPATLSDRMMEQMGGRLWLTGENARALRRVRSIIEGSGRAAARRPAAIRMRQAAKIIARNLQPESPPRSSPRAKHGQRLCLQLRNIRGAENAGETIQPFVSGAPRRRELQH